MKFKELIEMTISMFLIFIVSIFIILFYSCSSARATTAYELSNKSSNNELADLHQVMHYNLFDYYMVDKQVRIHILDAIYNASDEFGISPDLFMAIIAVESSFNPNSVSDKGALGLMQVMPSVWGANLKAKGIIEKDTDLLKINNNIMSGGYILYTYLKQGASKYSEEHDIIKYALFRYLGISSNYTENMDYYNKVLSILGMYHLYGGIIDTSFYKESYK